LFSCETRQLNYHIVNQQQIDLRSQPRNLLSSSNHRRQDHHCWPHSWSSMIRPKASRLSRTAHRALYFVEASFLFLLSSMYLLHWLLFSITCYLLIRLLLLCWPSLSWHSRSSFGGEDDRPAPAVSKSKRDSSRRESRCVLSFSFSKRQSIESNPHTTK